MRFADKLAKQRKNNNLSQELLADKMNMSRQAISKWESGSSYPDMDKMLQLCKILNCNLEDLMDDGVIGNTDNSKKKFDFNKSFKDFLSFITRSYNMFCSMKFKEKLKLIFELLAISFILLIISFIIYNFIDTIILSPLFSDYGLHKIHQFIKMIINVFLTVMSIIIFLHLFKIRYLDYYITIEDSTIKEKIIEEPIDKPNDKIYNEQKHEKIIIRDPKHSSFSFFDMLGKLVLLTIKIILMICAALLILSLFCTLIINFISMYHIIYNSIFLWISISLIGISIILFVSINFIYNFVFNQMINFKRNFRIAMVGLIIMCLGIGFGAIKFINLDYIKVYDDLEKETVSEIFKVDDKTYFNNIKFYNPEIIIDNSINDVKVEIEYVKPFKYAIDKSINHNDESKYIYIRISDECDLFNLYKIIINDLKNNKIRAYNEFDMVKVKVITNNNNYNLIK